MSAAEPEPHAERSHGRGRTLRVADLDGRTISEALRLLGVREAPSHRSAAARMLREVLGDHRTVRDLLEAAGPQGRDAFVQLVADGPAAVEDLADRGWPGRGALPAPLDWLQRRALVAPGADGRVHAVDEARRAYLTPTLDLQRATPATPAPEPAGGTGSTARPAEEPGASEARVLGARSVVVADAATIDRLIADADLALEAVSDTVAVGDAEPEQLRSALRQAGVALLDDTAVDADATAPALPTTPERAVGPKAVRALLARAVDERRQVWLRYFASSKAGATTERVVDPWALSDDLLRGWCHLRRDERTFAVGRIGEAVMLAAAIEHEPG